VDEAEEAKMIAALPAEALEALRLGGKGGLVEIDDPGEWDKQLEESSSTGFPLVVDFGGKFCKPCKAIKPFVEELSMEFKRCRFIYMDVDDCSEVALDRYGVVALPTFKVFKWGKEAASLTGVPEAELKDQLRKLVSTYSPVLPGEQSSGEAGQPAAEAKKVK
jgi:thioredoxin 1